MAKMKRREFLKISGATVAGGVLAAEGLMSGKAEAAQDGTNTKSASDVISLPKGGGSIRGIGETFQTNLFTGTGNLTVPIFTSPGRNGFGPKLTLQYSTGNGNGPFGLGWQLSIPRIMRKTEKGLPTYTDKDVFIISGAEDLVPEINSVAIPVIPGFTVVRYRPRTEGLFAKIENWIRNDGDTYWRATTKENITNIYGRSKSARITAPEHPEKIYEWLLEETFDVKGNHILYEYIQEDENLRLNDIFEENRTYTQAYIRRILYGNTPDSLTYTKRAGPTRDGINSVSNNATDTVSRHYLFEVLFDYYDLPDEISPGFNWRALDYYTIPNNWPVRTIRGDRFSSYRSTFEIRTLRLTKRVLMLNHFREGELDGAPLVKSTDFTYNQDPHAGFSMLKDVTVWGFRKDPNDSSKYLSRDMPPVSFGYSIFKPEEQHYQSVIAEGGDFPPKSLSDPDFALVDLFGDGLPDILNTTSSGYYYWQNIGEGNIKRRNLQREMPSGVTLSSPKIAICDMGGDGLSDLMVEDPHMSGFYEATPDGKWKAFKRFKKMPTFSLSDPNTRLIDLTGDGLTDVLVTRDEHFLWFRCIGEGGYDEPQAEKRIHNLNDFPDVNFSDQSGRVRLADMSGDGLNDIALVHNGRIDYWPNLGYNKWGSRKTMKNAPHFGYDFNPKQLFLVDLDGSGCADLVYIESGKIHFWFNQSGNSWSERYTIIGTPTVTDCNAIQFADFYGTGTSCLIWSYDYNYQPRGNYKILDFCGGQKPHLLVEMSNNMGATTKVRYAPSTKFYLEDRGSGHPWVTNLPFPVHVVEKTEVIDHIGKIKLVTTYKYHYGYYDGLTREFRGFGRVDQFDTEEFSVFSGSSLHHNIEISNSQRSFHVPPVLTKTWFHTGVYFDENIPAADGLFYDNKDMMDAYKKDFFQGDTNSFALNDHDVENGDVPHEAYRALRGSILRSEVYALDGTTKESYPYVVSENRYTVKLIQPKSANNHAVFLATQRESVSYHYERNPFDPRIKHEITIADAYGNITDAISIGYPRRVVPLELPEQGQIKILYLRTDFINNDANSTFYHIGVPCQNRTYEVTGIQWTSGDTCLKISDFQTILDTSLNPSNFMPYEWSRPTNHIGIEKRIIEWSRSFFKSNVSSAELDIDISRNPVRSFANRIPLGGIESLAIPYESYVAVFTSSNGSIEGLIDRVFQQCLDTAMIKEGGYHCEMVVQNQVYWWIPSGQQSFNANKFYLAEISRNSFGNDTSIEIDEYALLPTRTADAINNIMHSDNDYRVLQPFRVSDPNGSIAEVAFDVHGMVVGTAISGKKEDGTPDGDSLAGFDSDLDPIASIIEHITNPLNNPGGILQKATTRFIYDFKRYINSQQPNIFYTLARETHDSDLKGTTTKIQHSFKYLDGSGRIIQTKVQAEPDPSTPGTPRWISTGTKVFSSKGNPVQQYMPFFSDTHNYGIEKHGISPTLFYDPLERVLCTIQPNHTYEKVVFDPWQKQTWDANDTVLLRPHKAPYLDDYVYGYVSDFLTSYRHPLDSRPFNTWYDERIPDRLNKPNPNLQSTTAEQRAALKTESHACTPATTYLDTLGRPFLLIANNGKDSSGADILLKTCVELDFEGNDIKITDPRQYELNKVRAADAKISNFTHWFDLAGRKLRIESVDAGPKLSFPDVANKPLYVWDANGNAYFTKYDVLRRPTDLWVKESSNAQYFLAQKTIYGETKPNPEVSHHRQKVWKHYDGAGLIENEFYDFKSNPTRTKRIILKNGTAQVAWARTSDPATHTFDLTSATALLDTTQQGIYITKTVFDALNRTIKSIAPDNTEQVVEYNEANLLSALNLVRNGVASKYVEYINYNENAQRKKIKYGNQVVTHYSYDQETFRLTSINTTRAGTNIPKELQELKYFFDPVGHIIEILDDAHPRIYNHNNIIEPICSYRYDPIYRLIEATGREHEAMTPCHYREASKKQTEFIQLTEQPVTNGQALCNYVETYTYDFAGNVEKISHHNNTRNIHWNRTQTYDLNSNRLKTSDAGCMNENNFEFLRNHDANGNIIRMPHLPQMNWDFQNQLIEVQLNNGVNPNKAFYQYDASGQRIRKVVVKNGKIEERIYIGGYEVYLERNGGVIFRRDTLNIMDNKNRIALIEEEKKLEDNTIVKSRVRYQLSNHLGSSHLELDETPDANIISYEELSPWGETVYLSGYSWNEVSQKKYRYCGKEKDDETGLYYYGIRYFASFLARWISSDPAYIIDGLNLFQFVCNNPISFRDSIGAGKQDNSNNPFITVNGDGITFGNSSAPKSFRNEPVNIDYSQEYNFNQMMHNSNNLTNDFQLTCNFCQAYHGRPLIMSSAEPFSGNMDAGVTKLKSLANSFIHPTLNLQFGRETSTSLQVESKTELKGGLSIISSSRYTSNQLRLAGGQWTSGYRIDRYTGLRLEIGFFALEVGSQTQNASGKYANAETQTLGFVGVKVLGVYLWYGNDHRFSYAHFPLYPGGGTDQFNTAELHFGYENKRIDIALNLKLNTGIPNQQAGKTVNIGGNPYYSDVKFQELDRSILSLSYSRKYDNFTISGEIGLDNALIGQKTQNEFIHFNFNPKIPGFIKSDYSRLFFSVGIKWNF